MKSGNRTADNEWQSLSGINLSGMTRIRRAVMFSTCAIMTLNLRKLRSVSSMTTFLPGTADVLTTFMFLMERLIEEDNCDWSGRTKAVDSREYSPAGK